MAAWASGSTGQGWEEVACTHSKKIPESVAHKLVSLETMSRSVSKEVKLGLWQGDSGFRVWMRHPGFGQGHSPWGFSSPFFPPSLGTPEIDL